MDFIDLFAGMGGFHLALRPLGHRCVLACEVDKELRSLYERNFGIRPEGDIREVNESDVPSHDILCAGFPCQPFSKAGGQQGFECPKWGDLFGHVLRILRHHKPHYIMLENVPNLEKHDEGRTWCAIESELRNAGYDIRHKRLSPHRFGIPQIRDRMFIVGSRTDLSHFSWPVETPGTRMSIASVLDRNPPDARPLSEQVRRCLETWQAFLGRFPKDEELPSFPIWSMEFGATYPYEEMTPHAVGIAGLHSYWGSHGRPLRDLTPDSVVPALPSYAREAQARFPGWKVQFIRQNRALYQRHRRWIDEWMPEILRFPPSLQKLEWNCKGEERDIWKYVIQFRASGVRIKRPTTAPSLIAMTTTQVPIIAWEGRYMTPRECARLQSMEDLKHLQQSPTKAFAALGNAVNVELVGMVAGRLLMDGETASGAESAAATAGHCRGGDVVDQPQQGQPGPV